MRNTEKKILEKKITGRANTIILPSTATFKAVHRLACVMLFAKMVDEFRDMGLIAKAKKRKKQDEKTRLKFEQLDKKNARATGPMLSREFNRLVNEEKFSNADALEDLTLLLNERFAEIISHDPDTESEAGVDYDEVMLITPAMSKWLNNKFEQLVEAGDYELTRIFLPRPQNQTHTHIGWGYCLRLYATNHRSLPTTWCMKSIRLVRHGMSSWRVRPRMVASS